MLRLTFLFFILFTNCLAGQEDGLSKMEHRLDSLIEMGIDSLAFPGAQILVRYKDRIIFHKTWGFHTYNSQRKVQKDDLYDLASITKVTTGLPVLMKLFGEGKLYLDLPLKYYIDAYKRSNKKDLTLREVLAHQAGLQPYIVFWQQTLKVNGDYKCRTFKPKPSNRYAIAITDQLFLHKRYNRKMTRIIKRTPVKAIGNYVYSGLTFLLMPEMIRKLTGQSLESYLYKEIYTPIGIQDLTYNPHSKYPLERIIPTEYDSLWRKKLVHGTVHDEAAAMLNGVSCNAGLFGTARDLSLLFQLYLNGGDWNGQQIIAPGAVREFTDYQYPNNRRGLGFDKPMLEYNEEVSYVAREASLKSFGHSGFTGTMVWADPEFDLVYVFLSNRVYPSRDYRNLYRLSLRPRLQQVVYDYINSVHE